MLRNKILIAQPKSCAIFQHKYFLSPRRDQRVKLNERDGTNERTEIEIHFFSLKYSGYAEKLFSATN